MSLLDEEHILNEQADFAVDAWAADYANELISNIRFMGAVNSLPELSEDMIGEVYLLTHNDNLETYIALSNIMGELSWQLLDSI